MGQSGDLGVGVCGDILLEMGMGWGGRIMYGMRSGQMAAWEGDKDWTIQKD